VTATEVPGTEVPGTEVRGTEVPAAGFGTIGRTAAGPLGQEDLSRALEQWWHPVCTVAELDAAPGGVLATRLLGRDLAVARLGDAGVVALLDRCPHRSTRLSVGSVEGNSLRCAYHGWRFGADGACVEIPSAPGLPVPARAAQQAFSATEGHGLVWVRIDPTSTRPVPDMPATADPAMRVVPGRPYTWPTSAPRRVENFVDLAHFAWVHDGSLGRRDQPVPPTLEVRRCGGDLRFAFVPDGPLEPDERALTGPSSYRVTMPLTVDISFDIPGRPGVRRRLWMTASPLDPATCRSFWTIARTDGHDEPDEAHLAFQQLVLDEDLPVVCNQVPPEMPLDPSEELHTRADRVSVEYRRWLVELCRKARDRG